MKFAPSQSIVSQMFQAEVPNLWDLFPETNTYWSPDFLVLEVREHGAGRIAFSPDGLRLASGGDDKTLRLWSLAGEQLHVLGHGSGIGWVKFTSGGKSLASITDKWHVHIWDVFTGELLLDFHLSGSPWYDCQVAISPSGNIAWTDKNKSLWLCDPSGERDQLFSTAIMTFVDAPAASVAGLSDGDLHSNETRYANGEVVEDAPGYRSEDPLKITAIAFSLDGQLAVGTEDGRLMYWVAGIAVEPKVMQWHSSTVWSIISAPNGEFATCDYDNLVCIWSHSKGEIHCRWQRKFEFEVMNAMALSPNGLLALGSLNTVQMWNTRADMQVGAFTGHIDDVKDIAVSSRGQFASASEDETIRLWTIQPTSERVTEEINNKQMAHSEVKGCASTSDGTTIYSRHFAGEVRTWDMRTGKELQLFKGYIREATAAAISPDGTVVASGSLDAKVRMWDVRTGEELRCFEEHSGMIRSLAFSPDAKVIASASGACWLLWDAKTGTVLRRCEFEGGVTSLTFSPDGKVVVTAYLQHKVLVWDAQTGEKLHQFHPRQDHVADIAVNCQKVIALASDKEWPIQLWDGRSGNLLLELSADDDAPGPGRVEFCPSGEILHTNAGTFALADVLSSTGPKFSFRPALLRLNKTGDWIQHCGENVLWIPSEYRESFPAKTISQEHCLAIPTLSKGMVFFRLKK
jgi:WD40 repeat protein